MTRLPSISARECVRALEKAGFYVRRQKKHITMRRDEPYAQTQIPNHNKIDRGTLRAIIRQAGLTVDEFLDLL